MGCGAISHRAWPHVPGPRKKSSKAPQMIVAPHTSKISKSETVILLVQSPTKSRKMCGRLHQDVSGFIPIFKTAYLLVQIPTKFSLKLHICRISVFIKNNSQNFENFESSFRAKPHTKKCGPCPTKQSPTIHDCLSSKPNLT